MRIAVFYETRYGHTGAVAERIAEGLKKAGHEVAVGKCRKATAGDVSAAEAILVGSSVQMGRHRPKAISFVKANLEALKTKPSAFFSVSLSARMTGKHDAEDLKTILSDFSKATGWEPARPACFAGAIMYKKYWFGLRWLMKRIARSQGNDTDTSKDHVYTDWDQVDGFAADFAAGLEG